MVLGSDLERDRRYPGDVGENGLPVLHMLLDLVEFTFGQGTRLVEDRIGHAHLADIMQHAAYAELPRDVVTNLERSRKRGKQRAYVHGVGKGVLVLGAYAAELYKCARVPEDRIDDAVHCRLDALHFGMFAEPDIRHYPLNGLM